MSGLGRKCGKDASGNHAASGENPFIVAVLLLGTSQAFFKHFKRITSLVMYCQMLHIVQCCYQKQIKHVIKKFLIIYISSTFPELMKYSACIDQNAFVAHSRPLLKHLSNLFEEC
jgi:hypothetical protein